ncbi:hypothetical protein THRCLA_00269 [Thraustotheca clavata]|uniref:Secreted protein n=1 Tax=Thraustotheca clavata TaxID=74557 RepID=A0A1W0ABU4_9STRA|nr:hypothetical protein THRCLA_00269 [Thraustotheca clavata]
MSKFWLKCIVFLLISLVSFLEACRETLTVWLSELLDEQERLEQEQVQEKAKIRLQDHLMNESGKWTDQRDDDVKTECSSECSNTDINERLHDFQEIPLKLSSELQVNDYLCPCGECPWYNIIQDHVSTHHMPKHLKNTVIRVLQAYSTYNEAVGFEPTMVPWAQHCVIVSNGNEDAAFDTFIQLSAL